MTSFILFDTSVNPTSPSRRILSLLPCPVRPPLFLYDRAAPMSRIWYASAECKPERPGSSIARVRLTRE